MKRPHLAHHPVRLVMGLGMVLSMGVAGTQATWIDTASVSGSSMGTARVDLKAGGLDSIPNYPYANYSTLVPGASMADVLPVSNNGTVPLAYHINAGATNPDGKGLASALAVKVTGAAAVTGSPPAATCSGAALPNSGTTIGPNQVGSAAAPRTLAPGATENICFEVSLPSGAATTLQGATTVVNFSIPAVTSPATVWTDTVAIGGITFGTAAINAPVVSCTSVSGTAVRVSWTAMPGATTYRISDHTGVSDANVTSRLYTPTSSGTISVRAIYGSTTWISSTSNSRSYSVDGTTGSCT